VDAPVPTALVTKRACLAQVQICALGCCCGRTDRRKPAVPVDALKAAWKARALMKTVQLTFAGCLGPCDLVNVVAVMTADGATTWLGGLVDPERFLELADWADAVRDAGTPLPLPATLLAHRFDRWLAPVAAPT
jgi:cobaltochelatase CobN